MVEPTTGTQVERLRKLADSAERIFLVGQLIATHPDDYRVMCKAMRDAATTIEELQAK